VLPKLDLLESKLLLPLPPLPLLPLLPLLLLLLPKKDALREDGDHDRMNGLSG
jgi:hypothetical protein